jgi:tetratricopeptide (TPR) repeat protein
MADDASDASNLQPEQARFQLLESVRTLLDAITREAPVVLILEDLHAADSDSLQLLQYVARHAASMPLLLIGTYRDAEARSAQLDALWSTTRDARVLQLSRLAKDDVREYVLQQHNLTHSDDDVQGLFETTGGNPLFLTELVSLLAQHGESDSAANRLPDSVQQVIRQQVALLPVPTEKLLSEASVLGRDFSASSLGAISQSDEATVAALLQPAIDAGIVNALAGERYRFSHALHRDVLYHDSNMSDRTELHLRYAQRLKQQIEDGDADRWSELATHYGAAGTAHRTDAVHAWRNASKRAHERLAFEDAVDSIRNALNAFGDGPKYDPVERCELMLECAEALLLTGDIETGQQYCRDAFAIARALENSQLMSEAALTYGNVIIVAMIDKELIANLKECLAALPADNISTRARVMARMAAAMQPAVNPAEPMAIAREALVMARSTDDEDVLCNVLRYAISALMDFAPIAERIPLNREFESLAAKMGDMAGRFRSNLRLVIDAGELGDRQTMDDAIDACEQIARRIALPHYQWRVASIRAMQATIEGRFEDATRLLDEAQSQAEEIGDAEARITLPLQRFAILCEWNSEQAATLEDIESQLQIAYANDMGGAEFYIRPFVAAFTHGDDPAKASALIDNKVVVQRTFDGGDRFSLCQIGEIAALVGDRELAERCFNALEAFADQSATLGLLGSYWTGPVARVLGVIAFRLGRVDEARAFFTQALDVAIGMQAHPCIARIHARLAEVETELGNIEAARKHAETSDRLLAKYCLRPHRLISTDDAAPVVEVANTADQFALERQGDVWQVRLNQQTALIRSSKGLSILADLIARPGTEIHVLDLAITAPQSDSGDAGPMLDQSARKQYQQRFRDLQEELEEANEFGDLGRADTIRSEIDFISIELSRAFGIGGRERRASGDAERARVNVRRRVKDAIQRISEQLPDAGRYLENTIKTGTYCRYTPM